MSYHIYRYTMVVIGCLITASAINLFYIPNMLLSGGITGLGFLIYYLTGLPIGMMNIVLNIPLFYLSLAIDALHFLTAYTPDVPEKMLSCITGGVMYGIGMGIVYRVGGGTGGMDIVGGIINKYYSISQGTTNFIFNIFIMFCGTIAFGIEAVLYTMLTFFIVFKVTNSFASGFDYKKNIIIISEHYDEIASGIIKIVGRGVTYLYGEGAYTHQQRKVLFVVAKLTQVARIRQIVRKKDPGAFMIITEASDVFGRGFTSAPSGKHKQKKIFALINHYEEEGK